jgi:hypothetical protein
MFVQCIRALRREPPQPSAENLAARSFQKIRVGIFIKFDGRHSRSSGLIKK